MTATVSLEEYLKENPKLPKGFAFTYVHEDTGYPVTVYYLRRCKNKDKIRVERKLFEGQPNEDSAFWSVNISSCHVHINVGK
jgi:hypothetical protein